LARARRHKQHARTQTQPHGLRRGREIFLGGGGSGGDDVTSSGSVPPPRPRNDALTPAPLDGEKNKNYLNSADVFSSSRGRRRRHSP